MNTTSARFIGILPVLSVLLLSACSNQGGRAGLLEAKAIAEDGLIYGLPIVMNYAIMGGSVTDPEAPTYRAPFNQLSHTRKVLNHEARTVVTPNSDTPYSSVWLDLRAEPQIISVPQVPEGRYYSVHLIDSSTNNYGIFGSRATGNEAGDFMVVGPGWQGDAPSGIKKVFRSGSPFSLVIFRTQLFNSTDMPNVAKVQDGYRVRPLSAFLNAAAPPAPPAIDFPKVTAELAKKNFFDYLDFSLQYIPATAEEKEIRARLASIGVGPDKQFSFKDLPPLHKLAALWGMKAGSERIDARLSEKGKLINGWRVDALSSDIHKKGDWMGRAMVAKAGIYALDSVEAVYPMTKALADGTPLDTGKQRYSITLMPDSMPPAQAFWSITLYDAESQFLVDNKINRYLINSPMLPSLKKNPDGSITLYIQKDSPGGDKESNWLPGPAGPIYLVMRIYWPRIEAPSILPPGSGTWQPPALKLEQ